jgi:peroxiredoxin
MPQLNDWAARNGPNGVVVLGIDVSEDQATVASFGSEFGLDFPLLLDTNGEVRDRFRVPGTPASYLIGPDGTIVKVVLGPLQESDLAEFTSVAREATEGAN